MINRVFFTRKDTKLDLRQVLGLLEQRSKSMGKVTVAVKPLSESLSEDIDFVGGTKSRAITTILSLYITILAQNLWGNMANSWLIHSDSS